jgi:hypothetical protein
MNVSGLDVIARGADFEHAASRFELRPWQWQFLHALDGRTDLRDVASRCGVELAAATTFVEESEAIGLVHVVAMSYDEYCRWSGAPQPSRYESFVPAQAAAYAETAFEAAPARDDHFSSDALGSYATTVPEWMVETPVQHDQAVAETHHEEPVAETYHEEPVAETHHEEPVAEWHHEEAVVAEAHPEEPVVETHHEEAAVAETHPEEPVAEWHHEEAVVAETRHEEPVAETHHEEPVAETHYEEPVVAEAYHAESVAETHHEEPVTESHDEPQAEHDVAPQTFATPGIFSSNGHHKDIAWDPLPIAAAAGEKPAPAANPFDELAGISISLGALEPEPEPESQLGSVSFSLSPDDETWAREPAVVHEAVAVTAHDDMAPVAAMHDEIRAAHEPANGHVDSVPVEASSNGSPASNGSSVTGDLVGNLIARALTFRIK